MVHNGLSNLKLLASSKLGMHREHLSPVLQVYVVFYLNCSIILPGEITISARQG